MTSHLSEHPSPVIDCHIFLDHLPPLNETYVMDGPLSVRMTLPKRLTAKHEVSRARTKIGSRNHLKTRQKQIKKVYPLERLRITRPRHMRLQDQDSKNWDSRQS